MTKNTESEAGGPLAGVKILDLTSVVMGPFATQIMASLGAEITKVESLEGDNMRHVGPMRNEGMGHIFLHANKGKRSVALDLKAQDARVALLRMAAQSDVLISNVRPQALARLGLDYESVRTHNPRIIHVTCCGFGQTGPYAARPAYDDLIQGAAGVPWLMKQYGAQAPCYAPVTLADRVTGLHAVYAVTAALYAREKTGLGQAVEVPMFEAVSQFVLGDHMAGLSFEPPVGEAGYARLLTSHRKPYQTQDGYLCVLIYNDKHWKNFFNAIGDPSRMTQDERFSTHTHRANNIDAVYAYVGGVMQTRTTGQWQALLDEADIPNMPVNSPQDLVDDPHLNAVGFIQEVDHPTEGRLRTTGNPTRWSATPCTEPSPAPHLGQHTVQALREAGCPEDVIQKLLAQGSARQHGASA